MTQKYTLLILFLFLTTDQTHAMNNNLSFDARILSARGGLPHYVETNPMSPLRRALYDSDITTIKELIANGADVHEKNEYEATFLWDLINYRNHLKQNDIIEIINLLLQKGVDLNAPGCKVGATTLYQLYKKKDAPIIDQCIRWGAHINVKDIYGDTPLHNAAITNKKDIIPLLLFHDADHEAKNNRKKTAFDFTTKGKRGEEIKAMLKDRESVRKTIMPLIQEKEFCGTPLYTALKKREYTGSHKSIKKGITQLPMLPQ
jgi:ankyrin repeat protein